ncbi:SdpI family protein [Adhaeribacter sp. BT258]|uniref:SdpI family protein n=1 Tax=Adhaeribacter terrigena TaxID=2793070 RepID=A0ABS1C3P4_9BACT|nr:SdpI family protein [Adhaeribacter terrigena]MBK0404014.1 SdpI family protein [Adhaeribacter terrigena]
MPEIEKKIVLFLIIVYYLLWLLMGIIYYLKQPKDINGFYGYRTPRSMENLEIWHYANKLAAKYMLIITHVTVAISLLYFFLFKDILSFTATFLPINFFYCFSLVLLIPIVERKLKRFEAKQKSAQI